MGIKMRRFTRLSATLAVVATAGVIAFLMLGDGMSHGQRDLSAPVLANTRFIGSDFLIVSFTAPAGRYYNFEIEYTAPGADPVVTTEHRTVKAVYITVIDGTYRVRGRTCASSDTSNCGDWGDWYTVHDTTGGAVTDTETPTPTPTSTGTATPTPTPTVIAVPTSTPTAVSVEVSTSTPTATPTATPVSLSQRSRILLDLLVDLEAAISSDTDFTAAETAFVNCMDNLVDDAPESFDDALEMYKDTAAAAFDGCAEETGILDTYEETAKAKLTELSTPDSNGGRGNRAETDASRYASLLNTVVGRAFVEEVGSPNLILDYATYTSNPSELPWTAPGSTAVSTYSDIVNLCGLDTPPDGDTTPEDRMTKLNCTIFNTTMDFWAVQNNHNALVTGISGQWLYSDADRCTKSLDLTVYACNRHDVAYGTLQRIYAEEVDTEGDVMDDAWNPRNKYLSDDIFRKEIARYGCDHLVVGGLQQCGSLSKRSLANAYFAAVAGINSKGWHLSVQEVTDAETTPLRFGICNPPTIQNVNYVNDGWQITAEWQPKPSCISGVKSGKQSWDWAVEPVATYDTGQEITLADRRKNKKATVERDVLVIPTAYRDGMTRVSLEDFHLEGPSEAHETSGSDISPALYDHIIEFAPVLTRRIPGVGGVVTTVRTISRVIHRLASITFDGVYKVAPTTVGHYQTDILAIGITKSEPAAAGNKYALGEQVRMYPQMHVADESDRSSITYKWEERNASLEWVTAGGTNLAEGGFLTTMNTPGKRKFRVVATLNTASGRSNRGARDISMGGTLSEVLKATSSEVEVEWAGTSTTTTPTATATTTSTPTATATATATPAGTSVGTLELAPSNINGGRGTAVTVTYALVSGSTAEISYEAGVDTSSTCTSTAAGTVAVGSGVGTFVDLLYGCTAGDVLVKLVEKPSGDTLAMETLTVETAPQATPTNTPTPTPTPSPTPEPSTASISATRTTLDVGQSTVITFDYDLQGDDTAEIVIPDILGGSECRGGRGARSPQQLQGTYYGCSAGTGDVNVKLTHSPYTVLASLTFTVVQTTDTPTPTSTVTPEPTDTPTPTPTATPEPTDTPTPTPTAIPPCEGSVDASDTSIKVRERVDIDASYSGDCPSGVNLDWNSKLSTSDSCGPDVPRAVSTDIDRTLYGCVVGTGRVWLIDRSNNDTLDSVSITVSARPTVVPTDTPTPSPTPEPTAEPTQEPTGSLTASKSSVEIQESFSVHGSYNIPGSTYSLSITTHIHTNDTCNIPRSDDPNTMREVEVSTRASGQFWKTLYGCRAGTGTVLLRKVGSSNSLASVEVEVTLPDVPRPTGVKYTAGDNWLLFKWTAPEGGWNTFETKLDSGSWSETTNLYSRYNSLISGASYTFRVRTKASDGRTSNTVVIYAETNCADCYFRSNRGIDASLGLTAFGDGTHRVRSDIQASVYEIGSDEDECHWARLSRGQDGVYEVLEEGDYIEGRLVTIRESDHTFVTDGCGVWTKQ